MNYSHLHPSPTRSREIAQLRVRLAEAEQTLRAIRRGEVDAVVVTGRQGRRVFTLQGAEHDYRVLIESMNEGALTMTAGAVILYANRCFARMVECPLEKVMGRSFLDFLATHDRAAIRTFLKQTDSSGSKIKLRLTASNGSHLPVKISVRRLAKNGLNFPPFGMVVTDMAEAQRTEELLRALTRRVVQAQEDERGSVALVLTDNISQLLCSILLGSHTLAGKLSRVDRAMKQDAVKLCEMLVQTTKEVERLSRDLRPSALKHFGLGGVLRDTCTQFKERTGLSVKLVGVGFVERLTVDAELALYRILQEALKNVEQHARARYVTVSLTQQGAFIKLAIKDDGIGFESIHHTAGRKGKSGLGVLGMRERAASVGGNLTVKSSRQAGTEIGVRIPFPPRASISP